MFKHFGVEKQSIVQETWISLPPHMRPAHWKGIENPVCKLLLNLYGHPSAGLFCKKFNQEKFFKAGFGKTKGWKCLYAHLSKQLFLSVYVDAFKMAGKKDNLAPMWVLLGKDLDIEPPVPLSGNVYLGCQQHDFEPSLEVIVEKERFNAHIT